MSLKSTGSGIADLYFICSDPIQNGTGYTPHLIIIPCFMASQISQWIVQIEKMSGENESLRRTRYELETSVKNLVAEKDHIVNINEGLSIRIVEFEVQVQEMQSQFQSLQVCKYVILRSKNVFVANLELK